MIAPLLHDAPPRRAWAALLVLLMLGVCAMAFSPRPPSLNFDGADKWQHLAAFFCLSACAALALPAAVRSLAIAGLGMLAFGIFIEAVQMHLPARSAEWLDVLADSAGIALGLAAVALARRLWPQGAGRGGANNLE